MRPGIKVDEKTRKELIAALDAARRRYADKPHSPGLGSPAARANEPYDLTDERYGGWGSP